MSRFHYRVFVWGLVAAGVVALLALVRIRSTRNRSAAPAPAATSSTVRIATPSACKAIAREYRDRVHDLAACSVDDDCVTEARAGVWFGLDGCFRAHAAKAVMTGADEIAERWFSLGCAQDFEICPPPGHASCRWNHCNEQPPSQVHADWRRIDMGRTVTFFVPPDMVDQPAHGEDSIVRVVASPQSTLVADLGEWSNPLKFDREPTLDSEDPQWALITEQDLVIGGARARRVASRNIWAAWCIDGGAGCGYGWRFEIGLHIPDVPYRGLPTILLDHPKLTIVVQCDAFADCLVADSIFASVTFW